MTYSEELSEANSIPQSVNEVAYVLFDRSALQSSESIQSYISHLSALASPVRLRKAKSLRRPIDQLSSLAASALITIMLGGSLLKCSTPIFVGSWGKPFFRKENGPHFNISHSCVGSCCAISSSPVGVDIEGLIDSYEEISSYCLTEREVSYFSRADSEIDKVRLFTYIWTRKEALGKYLGCGMSESVLGIDVVTHPLSAEDVQSIGLDDWVSEKMPTIETFDCEHAFVSVCAHGDMRIKRYSLEEILTIGSSLRECG